MTFANHCEESNRLFGKPFEEVHRWLDQRGTKPKKGDTMNQEFMRIADRIAEAASDGGLDVKGIVDIVSTECGNADEVNCYPGIPGAGCHDLAIFISLHGKMKKGGGHYDFEQILQKLVQHAGGDCSGMTRRVVLVTDSWWAPNYEKWRGNIETIKRSGIIVEAYLIGFAGRVSLPI